MFKAVRLVIIQLPIPILVVQKVPKFLQSQFQAAAAQVVVRVVAQAATVRAVVQAALVEPLIFHLASIITWLMPGAAADIVPGTTI